MASGQIYPSLRVRRKEGRWFRLFPLFFAAFLLLSTLVFYHVLWVKLPWLPMNILIVDKTVPLKNFNEHNAIVWILKHYKAGPREGKFLSNNDFLGYHPNERRCETLLSTDISRYDLIYLADTYGTYDYKMGFKEYEANLPRKNLDVSLVCGGLDRKEAQMLLTSTKQAATIIGEFNILGFPTSLDPEALQTLEKVFKIKWTGWYGKHYDNLSSTPKWVKDLYEAVYGEDWGFAGPGTVMVKKSEMVGIEPDVMIFKDPRGYIRPFAIFVKKTPLTEGIDSPLTYDGWFEVVKPEKGTETIAYYHMAETPAHLAELRERGLKPIFPAIVVNRTRAKAIYFAGDFADNKFLALSPTFFGTEYAMKALSRANRTDNFFWRFYVPLMRNVLYW
ncbi:MAG: hypothetical protein QME66_04555 [Candidatus Eisenbacteria bacterium]|nr:hypothetical protein [Candidatus Eisenbacteria bacterium]